MRLFKFCWADTTCRFSVWRILIYKYPEYDNTQLALNFLLSHTKLQWFVKLYFILSAMILTFSLRKKTSQWATTSSYSSLFWVSIPFIYALLKRYWFMSMLSEVIQWFCILLEFFQSITPNPLQKGILGLKSLSGNVVPERIILGDSKTSSSILYGTRRHRYHYLFDWR